MKNTTMKTASFTAAGESYTLNIINSDGDYYIHRDGDESHLICDSGDFDPDTIDEAIAEATASDADEDSADLTEEEFEVVLSQSGDRAMDEACARSNW